ncbi:urease accessory protein UreD [Sagittula sp. M10.9X]|uniref:Urease accessory protein UreD n=2 Tax=Sagittula salina TaxID=2820268 RepID=A0A940MIQ7_9RHOB|nr:urease accessory protein UreD [Sagittula salina]
MGALMLSSKARGTVSAIDGFRTQGCMKALFPRRRDGVEAIVINTSGGLTGGDRLSLHGTAGAGSRLVLTTQAAERAYRSASGWARVETRLEAATGARFDWLPQELILFEGARLQRMLRADLAADARMLLVEPVIFGRHAMGEVLRDVGFRDRIEIWRGGAPLYFDALRMEGDLQAQMTRAAVGGGAGAMACIVYVGPEAEGLLRPLRALLPETGGASLVRPDVLVARVLACDGYALRQTLLPALDRLCEDRTGEGLPISWRL